MAFRAPYLLSMCTQPNCLHWIVDQYGLQPRAISGESLRKIISGEEQDEIDVLPLITQELRDHLQNGPFPDHVLPHPKIEYNDIPTNGRRNNIEIVVLNRENVQTEIIDCIGADCWSHYFKDNHGNIDTTYFNKFEDNSIIGNRDIDINYVLTRLANGDYFCISFGERNFLDYYFKYINDDSFIVVKSFDHTFPNF